MRVLANQHVKCNLRGLFVVVLLALTLACGGLTTERDLEIAATAQTSTAALPTVTAPALVLPTPTLSSSLPDLSVSVLVSMRGYDGGCTTDVAPLDSEICVLNRGRSDAGPFIVWAGERGSQGIWPVAGLAAGKTLCFDVIANLSGAPVIVDGGDDVDELREDNNTWWALSPTPPAICSASVSPTATLPLTPTETVAPTLVIRRFDVAAEDLEDGGKRVTFQWQVTGASEVRLFSGTVERLGWWRSVEISGTLTEDFAGTHFRNPEMTLIAYDARGDQVAQSVAVEWPCPHTYFFTPEPAACPLYAASSTLAAEQVFEHGRMIWLKSVRADGEVLVQDVILVLYDDNQRHEMFENTWQEGLPESDPTLTPPPGRVQPVRGFGKLWRENLDVRERVGWGLSPERAYTAVWQPQLRDSISSVAYLSVADGRVLRFYEWWQGAWEWVGE